MKTITEEELQMLKDVIGISYYMKGYLKGQEDMKEKYNQRQEILEREKQFV